MNDGGLFTPEQSGVRTFRPVPACALHPAPPWSSGNSAFHELIEFLPGDVQPEDKGPAKALGIGAVPRLLHKPSKELVGYGEPIDKKGLHCDRADRSLAVG